MIRLPIHPSAEELPPVASTGRARKATFRAALGVLVACSLAGSGCWSYTQVLTPAQSDPDEHERSRQGGVGYGTLVHVRAMYVVFYASEVRTYLTGMAGASGDGALRLADGTMLVDGLWRVMPPGWGDTSLSMQFCRGTDGGATGACVEAMFERPEGVSDAGFLSIIDPVNLGHTLSVATDSGGGRTTVTTSGSITAHTVETPLSPRLGVWVTPQMGTVFHCMLEADGPRCRPAMFEGRPLAHGTGLAVHTLRRPGGSYADVLWETVHGAAGPVRCLVDEREGPTPVCTTVAGTGG